MHRKFGALLAALAVLVLAWSGPVTAQTASYPLAESRWSGSALFEDGSVLPLNGVYFRSDGVLVYTDDLGTWDNARWRQRELVVTFQANDYFAVFVGLENDANRLSGSVYNMRGQRGTWTLTRAR